MNISFPIKELIIYKGLNCYDSCITTFVAQNLHKDDSPYVYLYHKLWQETDLQFDDYNNCFHSKHFMENLTKFWNARIDSISNDELMSIEGIILEKKSILVKTDLFHYSISPSFNIHHAPHFFLVHGFDSNNSKVFISDPSYQICNQQLDKDEFLSIQERLYVFEMQNDNVECDFYKEAIRDEIQKFDENISSAIGIIQERISDLENLECENAKDLFLSEALYFTRLASNRYCSTFYFEWLYQKQGKEFTHKEEFISIASKYEKVKNLFYKFAISGKRDSLTEIYREISQTELLLAKKILKEIK